MRQVLAAAAILSLTVVSGLQGQEGPYHAGPIIQIGGEGGWDYLSVDAAAHRLYVSHATHVVAIDTQTNKVVGDIPDTPGVHGFAIASDIGKGFASNGRENKVSVVDLKTLKLVTKVDTGENPDWILYEPSKKEVYTMNGRGKSSSVIDTATNKVVATIPLEGKPETAMADSKAGKIYVNMEDLNSVKVIDIATHKVTATWPAAPCESASGLAFDVTNHRLFLGCDNKLMVMMDSTTGKVVYSVPIGDGVDATSFDPQTKLAFSSNGGAGTVTVAHEDSPSVLKVVQTIKTVRGARTMLIDAGVGGKDSAKFHDIFGIDRTRSLEATMAEAGITPEDIDIVLASHLHFDHAGGFTYRDAGGTIRPTFPRAQYIVRRVEYEDATHTHERNRASYLADNYVPLADAGVLQLVDDDATIMPGVRVRRTGGHCMHHQAVMIESKGKTAAFAADLIPTTAHLPAAWIMGFDLYPMDTLAAKKQFLDEAIAKQTLVFFEHDPAIAAGYIQEQNGKRIVQPAS